jgi:hypothetical protein
MSEVNDGASVPETPADDVSLEEGFTGQEPQAQATEEPSYARITQADYEALLARQDANSTQFDKAFGHIGQVRQTLEELKKHNEGRASAQISVDAFKELEEDFPSLAEKIVKGLNSANLPMGGGQAFDPAVLEQTAQRIAQQTIDAVIPTFELKILKARHPDHIEISKSTEFSEWINTRPEDKEKIFASNDSDYVASVLSEFKARKAPASSNRQRQIQAAIQPKSTGQNSGSTVDHFEQGFNSR